MSNAIPTEYCGIRMRSRLEATWAAFFDLLGWSWEYEPFDLNGYIPDFFIPNRGTSGHCRGIPDIAIVDVKPLSTLRELAHRGSELLGCGWTGDIFCVGSCLPESFDSDLVNGTFCKF